MSRKYTERLKARIADTGSALCVGLDPRPEPGRSLDVTTEFLAWVVDECAPYAAAFKPNIAYFEAMGAGGVEMLEKLVTETIPEEIPVILDAKRGDIGETQKFYAQAYFDRWKVDAVTLSPFLGFDTLEPFLAHAGRAVYLLGVTSNPGASDIELLRTENGERVFEHVQRFANRAADAGHPGEVGLVVGLTNAEPDIMDRIADLPLLIPGLGAQGGNLAALDFSRREAPSVINVSRGILYSDPDKSFGEKARAFCERIADALGT